MILPFFIIIPLAAAFLITLVAGKKDNWGVFIAVVAAAVVLLLAVVSFLSPPQVPVYKMGNWDLPIGICLVQDALSIFMLIVVSLVSLTSLIFSIQYIRHIDRTWKYYALFMLLITGMNGVVLTGDLFNLFVFMEIALMAAFALVAFGGRAEEYEAAFKYAVMGGLSSSIILIGIAIVYSATSTLTLAVIAERIKTVPSQVLFWVGGMFIAGFGLKAAIFPFHAWLPDAHSSAPAPISSMLSGVLIKILGIYAIMRIFFVVFKAPPVFQTAFLLLGALSIVIGGVLSINQWDMKRLLAYSSISQIGYILLGLGLGTTWGYIGALFHLANHAIFKSLLFYSAGAVEMATGTRDLRKLGNLAESMPVTSGSSLVGSLAISGIPPFNGFFSKLILIYAAVAAGQVGLAIIAVVGSLLTLAALLKVQRYGFRSEKTMEKPPHKIAFSMNSMMVVLAALCILTSLLALPAVREVVLDPAAAILQNQEAYLQMVLGR